MSDPVIVGAIVAGLATAGAAAMAARSAKGNTLVTGQASFIDDYREELERTRNAHEADRVLLTSQITEARAETAEARAETAEARAEIASLKAEAAARCAGDLIVDNAIGDTP